MYFIGNGDFATDDNALITATEGLTNPSLIMFMTSTPHLNDAALKLQMLYPKTQIIGGGGYALQAEDISPDMILVVGFGDEVEAVTGIITDISICPVSAVGSIIEKMEAIQPGDQDTVCFQFSAGYGERIVTLFDSVLRKKGVQMLGATTFDWSASALASPAVCFNGTVYEDACVYAFIKNRHGRIKVFRENIYKVPEDATIHIANKANKTLGQLYELDEMPAADLYFDEIGFSRDDAITATMLRPLGRIIGDEVFVIAIEDISEDNGLITHKRVNINDSLYILVLDDIVACVNRTISDISKSMDKISMVVCINCAYRQSLFDKMNFSETYCTMMKQLGPFVSFVGGGEQGFGQNMNQSMVCMVFE